MAPKREPAVPASQAADEPQSGFFVLFVDLLGFEQLAVQIGSEKGISASLVRERFIAIIDERVRRLVSSGLASTQTYGERDDWLLLIADYASAIVAVAEITRHSTDFTGYEQIPVEMALGRVNLSEDDQRGALVVHDEVIAFLKSGLTREYRSWRKKLDGRSVTTSYLVLSHDAAECLDPLDRKRLVAISPRAGGDHEPRGTFYDAPIQFINEKASVFTFLEAIGRTNSNWYSHINDAYVPPMEFADIAQTLSRGRIVFITGTQEYGKTYTAVRLMWEYYRRGYEPWWVPGDEASQRIEVRESLEHIAPLLKKKRVLYFEDPFGKTRYEKREGLERIMGSIVDMVKQVDDVFVVITSRDEVFKEFKHEKVSPASLAEFERNLNIKRPSYDAEKRQQILLLWAELMGCQWLLDRKSNGFVQEAVGLPSCLPTPLSIRAFASSSVDTTDTAKLRAMLQEKSKETSNAFAAEIPHMSPEKRVLLATVLVAGEPTLECVSVAYAGILANLGIRNPVVFSEVLEWFVDDKLSLADSRVSFAHPSYLEAVEHAVLAAPQRTGAIRLVETVLTCLAGLPESRLGAARFIKKHFDSLAAGPRDVAIKTILRNCEQARAISAADLVTRLARSETAATLVEVVEERFSRIDPLLRRRVLRAGAEDYLASKVVARVLTTRVHELDQHTKTSLWTTLARHEGDNDVMLEIARALNTDYESVPKRVLKRVLPILLSQPTTQHPLWAFMEDHPSEIPEEMRKTLAHSRDETIRALMQALEGQIP